MNGCKRLVFHFESVHRRLYRGALVCKCAQFRLVPNVLRAGVELLTVVPTSCSSVNVHKCLRRAAGSEHGSSIQLPWLIALDKPIHCENVWSFFKKTSPILIITHCVSLLSVPKQIAISLWDLEFSCYERRTKTSHSQHWSSATLQMPKLLSFLWENQTDVLLSSKQPLFSTECFYIYFHFPPYCQFTKAIRAYRKRTVCQVPFSHMKLLLLNYSLFLKREKSLNHTNIYIKVFSPPHRLSWWKWVENEMLTVWLAQS